MTKTLHEFKSRSGATYKVLDREELNGCYKIVCGNKTLFSCEQIATVVRHFKDLYERVMLNGVGMIDITKHIGIKDSALDSDIEESGFFWIRFTINDSQEYTLACCVVTENDKFTRKIDINNLGTDFGTCAETNEKAFEALSKELCEEILIYYAQEYDFELGDKG